MQYCWFSSSLGAEKSDVDEAVKALLDLKAQYKALTGIDLSGGGSSKKDKKAAKKSAAASAPVQNLVTSKTIFFQLNPACWQSGLPCSYILVYYVYTCSYFSKVKPDNRAQKQQSAKAKVEATPKASEPAVAAPVKPAVAAPVKPADVDMGITAVLARLATRATKADQIIAQLKAQLSVARQAAGTCHACM